MKHILSKQMTLEEAIMHAKEVAQETDCAACSEDHAQLVVWLQALYNSEQLVLRKECSYEE